MFVKIEGVNLFPNFAIVKIEVTHDCRGPPFFPKKPPKLIKKQSKESEKT